MSPITYLASCLQAFTGPQCREGTPAENSSLIELRRQNCGLGRLKKLDFVGVENLIGGIQARKGFKNLHRVPLSLWMNSNMTYIRQMVLNRDRVEVQLPELT